MWFLYSTMLSCWLLFVMFLECSDGWNHKSKLMLIWWWMFDTFYIPSFLIMTWHQLIFIMLQNLHIVVVVSSLAWCCCSGVIVCLYWIITLHLVSSCGIEPCSNHVCMDSLCFHDVVVFAWKVEIVSGLHGLIVLEWHHCVDMEFGIN